MSLQYQVTIYMPQIDDKTYTLSQLSINLPEFSHSLQNLQEYIAINKVNITGDSSSVHGVRFFVLKSQHQDKLSITLYILGTLG